MAVVNFPNEITASDFLQNHWQKCPLFMPGGLERELPALTSDELGWLATLEDVESRLIFTERGCGACSYRIQHGPFENDELSALPDTDWTLLVQDVEKHLPDFRAWLDCTDFVPDWRIDDLMVSFAAPGGSVGPHRDNYDVFLCQGEGKREWQVATAALEVREVRIGELALLEPFVADNRYIAAPDDVLYLPPGAPHWGIALDACMTYSIGMRAPELVDLKRGLERLFPDAAWDDSRSTDERPRQFYSDPDLQRTESLPGQISGQAVSRARRSFPQLASLDPFRFLTLLGSVLTDPKAWLAPDQPDESGVNDLLQRISRGENLLVHGMARLAWYAGDDGQVAFANGRSHRLLTTELPIMQQLCRQRQLCPAVYSLLEGRDGDSGLLYWLLQSGVLDFSDDALRSHPD